MRKLKYSGVKCVSFAQEADVKWTEEKNCGCDVH